MTRISSSFPNTFFWRALVAARASASVSRTSLAIFVLPSARRVQILFNGEGPEFFHYVTDVVKQPGDVFGLCVRIGAVRQVDLHARFLHCVEDVNLRAAI